MTTQDRQPNSDSDNTQVALGEAAQPEPEAFAISPAVGGLPSIYVARSPTRAGSGSALWRATIRAARRVVRRLTPHHSATEPRARRRTLPQEKR